MYMSKLLFTHKTYYSKLNSVIRLQRFQFFKSELQCHRKLYFASVYKKIQKLEILVYLMLSFVLPSFMNVSSGYICIPRLLRIYLYPRIDHQNLFGTLRHMAQHVSFPKEPAHATKSHRTDQQGAQRLFCRNELSILCMINKFQNTKHIEEIENSHRKTHTS